MSAANVPLVIDQGEDWSCQIVWTDDYDEPFNIVRPCQMDIKTAQGATQLSLESIDVEDGVIPPITVSSEIGMIQLHIEDTATAALRPGVYYYDLFVTVNDGSAYAGNQRQRLIAGQVTVNKRITQM